MSFIGLGIIISGIAAATGITGHIDAKETNELAQKLSNDAQTLYNNAKNKLEIAKTKSEISLKELGTTKKTVLETSVKQFLRAYERIKDVQFNSPTELNELSKLMVDNNSVLQLQKMTDIYESAFSSGAAGAATGALITLAASGSLPIVTGTLSIAGSFLAVGEIGTAASLAGSALSFGAAMTPLAAIAAPVVLFTGVSSAIKAEENYEKAKSIYAQAEAAAEKMKTSTVLCDSISRKAEMFNTLLTELNVMFSASAKLMDDVTVKITGRKKHSFTKEELELFAVSRALCGAVKSILDTPILDSNGKITAQSQNIYNDINKKLPDLSQSFKTVSSYNYSKSASFISMRSYGIEHEYNSDPSLFKTILNFLAIVIGVLSGTISYNIWQNHLLSITVMTICSLIILDNNTFSKLFRIIKNTLCISLCIESAFIIKATSYKSAGSIGSALISLVIGIVLFFIWVFLNDDNHNRLPSIRAVAIRFSALLSVFFAARVLIGVLGYISVSFATIFTLILFVPISLIAVFTYEILTEDKQ